MYSKMMECMWGVAPEKVGGGFEAQNPFFKLIEGSRPRRLNAALVKEQWWLDMKKVLIFIEYNT